MLKNRSYITILFLCSSMYLQAAPQLPGRDPNLVPNNTTPATNTAIKPGQTTVNTQQPNTTNIKQPSQTQPIQQPKTTNQPVVTPTNQPIPNNSPSGVVLSKTPANGEMVNSQFLQELETAIDKINKQDLERKKQYEEEQRQLQTERERLNNAKTELEKERILQGMITKDDVDKEKDKIEKEKQMLQQKMQYNQILEQYNATNIDIQIEMLKDRIKYFQDIKKMLLKEFVINSEQFDYVKVSGDVSAYVSTTILDDIVKKADAIKYNDDDLTMKIKALESFLSVKNVNELKQILNLYAPNIYRPEKSMQTMSTGQNISYTKISEGQYLADGIYVKEINQNTVTIVRD